MQAHTAAANVCLDAPHHKQSRQLLHPGIVAAWLALLLQLRKVRVAAGRLLQDSSHASMLTNIYALTQHTASAEPLVQ